MSSSFAPTVKQLKAFLAVYELKKLSLAADHLHLSQPATSILIKQLEEGLGLALFDRSARALAPTPSAHELFQHAQPLVHKLEGLQSVLLESRDGKKGVVKINITPTLGEILLPPVVRQFAQLYPDIKLVVHDCAPEQFINKIYGDDVDFGIGTPEIIIHDLLSEVIMDDALVLVVPHSHPLARKSSMPWIQLRDLPLITIRKGYGIRDRIDAAARQAGVRLTVVNEVSFLATALWMVESGLGFALMPAAYARAHRSSLHCIALTEPSVLRSIECIRRRDKPLSPQASLLLDMIKKTWSLKHNASEEALCDGQTLRT